MSVAHERLSNMKRLAGIAAAILIATIGHVNAATTLLPNGKQCFADANGALSGGSVYMYVPNTTTFKQTWQDASQSVLNSQPILLDADGCAVIYGTGIYRQQVYKGPDNTSTLMWDQPTTDTSAFNSVFWAGLAGGTGNVITVTDPGFNGTDGTVIQFIALNTNTGATTINPSGYGAISVVKDTTSGPIALTGGEITAGNVISVVYYATTNTFHLLNAVIQSASGSTSPSCSASNLLITNGGSLPNQTMTITADQAVMQSASGIIINRANISVTLNITTGTAVSTANGMDAESPGTSSWVYVWLIDNGAASASLGSAAAGNGTSPVLPSGYTYKCRVGAVRVDSGGNLMRTRQAGKVANYVVTAGTNTASTPAITNGLSGANCNTAAPTYTSTSVANFVPPTARQINVAGWNTYNNNAATTVAIAPSTAYAGSAGGVGNVNPPLIYVPGAATGVSVASFVLTAGTTIGYCSNGAGGAALAVGWTDAVAAN